MVLACSGRDEIDRALGTGDNTQAAGEAQLAVRRIRRLHAVEGQRAEVCIADRGDVEHVVGTHLDTIALRLASVVIHDRNEGARLRLAARAWTLRMLRRLARLGGIGSLR